jgi:hypothetical protein
MAPDLLPASSLEPDLQENKMTSLKYRVRLGTSTWSWEVLDHTGEVLASGTADTDVQARAAAMREAMRFADQAALETSAH